MSRLYLWKERTLFLGTLDEPLSLSQGAATLCISLADPIFMTPMDDQRAFSDCEPISCSSVLIPPGCSVHIDTRDQVIANLNLDVMGTDLYHLSQGMTPKKSLFFNLVKEAEFKAVLQGIYHNRGELADVKSTIETLLQVNDGSVIRDHYTVDARVQVVVDLIQSEIGQNLSIEYLAESVHLSVPGLTKLFKKQTGVPIRRYRQWHRLYVTATEIGKGKSLTDAAQVAGFVDLSHCSHTFNLMLGMKPSFFLSKPSEIKVIAQDS